MEIVNDLIGKNVLITTSEWFFAPDGQQYRAVWGKVLIVDDKLALGIKTNTKSTNWYAVVGDGDKRAIIAGCQIKYAVCCFEKPILAKCKGEKVIDTTGEVVGYEVNSVIYLAQ
jgi:hypothetical protein